MPAIIHVKLSGEGDFGPVDLECAIPPARLPVVMAALFGQTPSVPGMAVGAVRGSVPGVSGGGRPRENGEVDVFANESAGAKVDDQAATAAHGVPGAGEAHRAIGYTGDAAFSGAVDPGMFITGFVGSFADLVGRLQPRGFAEIILLAAIWLQYRDGRSFVTRGDVRRLLRRQDHLRMPRNFSRDFHAAAARGYLEEVEGEDGYTVATDGFHWFRNECTK
ncbi:MAG: hypothetical protein JJ871_14210 [Thalassospira sp.]|uniref:hypothetical protein n=1 Tax=Thalassospira sp. TaxID=1912094 RepID=UPI001B2F192C|nr:hypothetical protein [Thalassospira sp.]MBO6580480.1 hypothetical protein [Thalassospira sp.]MBO6804940.1 hypothetical protein [Thalassospira sp.]MBO6820151.1 hypothetical protein [Thalassospira sp.]MBO6889208.1 hypothetical protein [Thalassospira sp.]